jgi:transposase-like protein
MSEETLALVITIAIIALFFAWVPFLNLICPLCSRFLERRRLQIELAEEQRYRSSVHLDPKRLKLYEFLNNSRLTP